MCYKILEINVKSTTIQQNTTDQKISVILFDFFLTLKLKFFLQLTTLHKSILDVEIFEEFTLPPVFWHISDLAASVTKSNTHIKALLRLA